MAQIKTAREVLAWVEKDYFNGTGLEKASHLEGDERRAYVLAQVERLLATVHGATIMALLLSDIFWTADEGRKPMPWLDGVPQKGSDYPINPLLSLQEQQTLSDKEMGELRLILEVAGLCHDLGLHFPFDPKASFGVKGSLWKPGKQLVDWLTTTEYQQIAMHTAYTMKKQAIDVYAFGHYQPAQDALAELFSSEYRCLVREPKFTNMPPRAYVKTILDELLRIDRHWQRGHRLKLRPDLVMLHDEIYGVVPRQFDKDVLKAAQVLYDYMDKDLYGRLTQIERKYNVYSWNELPEEGRRLQNEVLKRFAEIVRKIRDEYLADGWVADDSLEFNYLMAHAQRCGYGYWREEDEAL